VKPVHNAQVYYFTNFSDFGQPLVNPVHNAQVYYFNNVWLMFLVLRKNFFFSNNRWGVGGVKGGFRGGFIGRYHRFFNTSVCPVHNAQVK